VADGKSRDRLSIERLYPLRAGSVWTYDVDTGEGVPTLAITRVVSSADKQAEVSSGGAPIRYEQRADGLYRADRAVYVLKLPLRVGAIWDAGQGATAEVTDLDKRVSTVAGEFSGCVEVRERSGEGQKQVRTVFCPDVGPVEVESTLQLAITGRGARVLAQLRGYDFSGALGSL
jgi:ribosomal protein S28E/S33